MAPSIPSTSSMSSTPMTTGGQATEGTASAPKAKPIKLRAACNHCFSAKVRCDGNKEGCRRCCEKKLSCIYSESRVGKVVGKRRKRPIDDSIGSINSPSWFINNSVPIQSIPSPAATHTSDDVSKRHCNTPCWSPYIVGGEQGFLSFEETTESLSALDMADNRSYSMASDASFFSNNGLPTPGLSPPQFTRYLSPAQLEARPVSRQSPCPTDSARLHPQQYGTLSRSVEPGFEDQETICIKLLGHLKKHSADDMLPREVQLDLLKKSNAAVRRLLRSQTVRSDYTCHLLLSSIINHLVRMCERLCEQKWDDSQYLHEQVHFEGMPGFFDTPVPQSSGGPLEHDLANSLIQEVMVFTTIVGDCLKRRPISGFQHLGRHETFHVELEQRLRRATVSFLP
ncbi:hypothetical protein H2200_011775 [Cladophialophora chaetospira]|uniref:Zn(2)-C6 fungal-type domain-containing protein n=1 Tax=Cladophialophora chaetospira TaxID=386627 RepID=A0AA39CCU4_9EURO|nr:hypothetical protein H2200_011775 [Cladophialophora chaetospira]